MSKVVKLGKRDRLMTPDEVVERLALRSREALRTLRRQGRIGFVRHGHRTIVFRESEVEAYIERNSFEARR